MNVGASDGATEGSRPNGSQAGRWCVELNSRSRVEVEQVRICVGGQELFVVWKEFW